MCARDQKCNLFPTFTSAKKSDASRNVSWHPGSVPNKDKHFKDTQKLGGGPRIVFSTAAFHARARGSLPVSAVCKKQKCFFPIHS